MAEGTHGDGGPLSGRPGSRVSARWRIAGWITVTTSLGLAVLAFSTTQALRHQVVRDADADVTQHAEELRAFAEGGDRTTGAPFTSTAALLGEHLGAVSPGGDEVLVGRDLTTGRTWSASGDGLPDDAADRLLADPRLAPRLLDRPSGAAASPLGPVRWVTTTVRTPGGDEGRYVAVEVLTEDLAEVAVTTRTVAAVAVVSALVTAGWALVVAGQVLRPLRVWRSTVEDFSTGRRAARIPVEGDDDLAAVARAVNEVLDDMQAAVDHEQVFVDEARREVAAPLTAARRALVPGASTAAVAAAVLHLDRVERVLDDLHDLAASRRPDFVRPEPVDPAVLSRDLLAAARDHRPDRTLALTEAAGGEPVRVDAARVREAVLRLTANADRLAPAGATVELATALRDGPAGRELVVTVSDRGPGLDGDQARHVFDRLRPGDETPAGAPRRGLGLALVRAVADAHAGAAFVRSAPGRGATFGLALPVDGPPAPAGGAR